MPRSKDNDSSLSKNQQKAKYFKQIGDSPSYNLRESAKSVPVTKNQFEIPASENDDLSSPLITTDSSITNPETSVSATETDSLSSLSS